MKRVALAFLLAPFPAALFQSVIVGLWPKKGMGVFEHPFSMFVAMCLVFYFLELIFALPLFLAVRNRLPERASTYGLVGASIALLPIVLGFGVLAVRGTLSVYSLLYDLTLFVVGGYLAGVVFWRVAKVPTKNDALHGTLA